MRRPAASALDALRPSINVQKVHVFPVGRHGLAGRSGRAAREGIYVPKQQRHQLLCRAVTEVPQLLSLESVAADGNRFSPAQLALLVDRCPFVKSVRIRYLVSCKCSLHWQYSFLEGSLFHLINLLA